MMDVGSLVPILQASYSKEVTGKLLRFVEYVNAMGKVEAKRRLGNYSYSWHAKKLRDVGIVI